MSEIIDGWCPISWLKPDSYGKEFLVWLPTEEGGEIFIATWCEDLDRSPIGLDDHPDYRGPFMAGGWEEIEGLAHIRPVAYHELPPAPDLEMIAGVDSKPRHRIVESLESAIAHAKGDETRARSTMIST